jgi:hypothetical protein
MVTVVANSARPVKTLPSGVIWMPMGSGCHGMPMQVTGWVK